MNLNELAGSFRLRCLRCIVMPFPELLVVSRAALFWGINPALIFANDNILLRSKSADKKNQIF
jgi:hypothetical protein